MKWVPVIGQPGVEKYEVGHLTFYRFENDSSVTVAENEIWISAIFADMESALSWDDHWDEAERKFLDGGRVNLAARAHV